MFAAHWEDPWSQEATRTCSPCLPVPPNQRIRHGEIRPVRPIERAGPFAPLPSQLGGGEGRVSPGRRHHPIPESSHQHTCGWGTLICRSAFGVGGFPASAFRCGQISSPGGTTIAVAAHSWRAFGSSQRIGSSTSRKTGFSPWPSPARVALMTASRSGGQGLRPLAPPLLAGAGHQRSFSDPLGFARPFLPSSPSHSPRLGTQGIGGGIPLDRLGGVLEQPFQNSWKHLARLSGLPISAVVLPGPNDRQDSTFPRKVRRRVADAHFPAVPPRVRRASEGVTQFSLPTPKNPSSIVCHV